jgi:hypothetical protein
MYKNLAPGLKRFASDVGRRRDVADKGGRDRQTQAFADEGFQQYTLFREVGFIHSAILDRRCDLGTNGLE